MLSFERLRILHAVATRGSVSAAAKALHVTDSAVSQQIAKLETELGQTLLERSGRGVRLTSPAAVLVEHTQRMLSLLESAEAEFDAQRENVFGQVAVAAFPTAARGLAPAALEGLRASYPQLRVVICEREPPESVPALIRGDVDLVIGQDWENAPLPQPEGLERAHLLDDVADIALYPGHPLASREVVDLDDLRSDPWITWGQTGADSGDMHIPARWCDQWLVYTLRSRGHEPLIAHTACEHATQLALVRAGLGVCVIPRLGRDPLPRGVRIVGVRPVLRRHIYALWRAANTRRRAIALTIEAFRQSAEGIRKGQPSLKTERARKHRRSRRAAHPVPVHP
jgi:molybdate transport repressor ModE-like protein